MSELFDVHAVNIKTGASRVMEQNLTAANAEAYIKIAVWRRGVDEEYYVSEPAGTPVRGPRQPVAEPSDG